MVFRALPQPLSAALQRKGPLKVTSIPILELRICGLRKLNQSVKGLKCMVGSSTQLSHTDLVPSPGLRPFQCATETALLPADAFLSSALARVLP